MEIMNILFMLMVLLGIVFGSAPSSERVNGVECACRSSSLIEDILLFPLSLLKGDCYNDAGRHHDEHGTNLLEFVLETGGTLVNALFHGKVPISWDTHFDDEEEWTENNTGTDLKIVAVLELGHAIVPGHINVMGALMQPFYGGYDPKYILQYDGIGGAQILYGKCFLPYADASKPGPDCRLHAFRYRQIYQFNSNGVGIAQKFQRNVRKVFPKEPNNIGATLYDYGRFKRRFYIFTGKTSKVGYVSYMYRCNTAGTSKNQGSFWNWDFVGTLANALFHGKAPISWDTHFDDDEEWTERNKNGTDLEIVAALELGHAIVLGHSNVKRALMQPFYGGYDPKYILQYDDICGAQILYGKCFLPYADASKPGTLANALFHGKAPINWDTHFDEEEEWTESNKKGTDLKIVAVLELGQAIVLGHSNVKGALMQQFYGGYDPKIYDGIGGAQILYGGRSAPSRTTPRPAPKPIPSPKMIRRPSPTQQPDDDNVCNVNFDDIANGPDGRLYAFRYRQIYKFNSNVIGIAWKFRRSVRKVFQTELNDIGIVYDGVKITFYILLGLCLLCFGLIIRVNVLFVMTIIDKARSILRRFTRFTRKGAQKNKTYGITKSALNKVEMTGGKTSVIQTSALDKVETTKPPINPIVQHSPTVVQHTPIIVQHTMVQHTPTMVQHTPIIVQHTMVQHTPTMVQHTPTMVQHTPTIVQHTPTKLNKQLTARNLGYSIDTDIPMHNTVTRRCTFADEGVRGHVMENDRIIDMDRAAWVNNNVSFHTGDGVFEVIGLFGLHTVGTLAQQAWQRSRDNDMQEDNRPEVFLQKKGLKSPIQSSNNSASSIEHIGHDDVMLNGFL